MIKNGRFRIIHAASWPVEETAYGHIVDGTVSHAVWTGTGMDPDTAKALIQATETMLRGNRRAHQVTVADLVYNISAY